MLQWKPTPDEQKKHDYYADSDNTPRDQPILYGVKKGHSYLSLAARRPAMPPTIAPGSPPTAAPAKAPRIAKPACLSADVCCIGTRGE